MVSSLPLFLIIYDKNKMKLSLLKCLRKWRTTIRLLKWNRQRETRAGKSVCVCARRLLLQRLPLHKTATHLCPHFTVKPSQAYPARFYQWIDYLKNESVSRSGNWRQIQSGISACVMSSEHFTRTSLYLVRLEIFEWINMEVRSGQN